MIPNRIASPARVSTRLPVRLRLEISAERSIPRVIVEVVTSFSTVLFTILKYRYILEHSTRKHVDIRLIFLRKCEVKVTGASPLVHVVGERELQAHLVAGELARERREGVGRADTRYGGAVQGVGA